MEKSKKKKIIPVLIIMASSAFFWLGIKHKSKDKPLRELPYFGKSIVDSSLVNGVWKKDTLPHRIGTFSFIDQKGNSFTQEQLKDKIYVADYFFCTCQSICPVMTKQMGRVAKIFSGDEEVKFVSHTVNPEYDSVNVLADYALANEVVYGQWYLLTGSKKELYSLAREGYMMDASQGDGGADDFIHTQNFALIDKDKRIRGYYDGTDSTEVNTLINDLKLLKQYYRTKGN
jgi:protein SCO1/2